MRVVVYPHRLEIGGSQINAVELAGEVQAVGHEVIVFGQPGRLVGRVVDMGVEFVAAPRPRGRPSPKVMHALRRLVAARGVDVVHGYERALAEAPRRRRDWIAVGGSSAGKLLGYRMGSRLDQVRGRLAGDDFNANAVAARAPLQPVPEAVPRRAG